jgi:diguanylate cyclase (GGDEF)-like protein/PAS domain S-box-containing protein
MVFIFIATLVAMALTWLLMQRNEPEVMNDQQVLMLSNIRDTIDAELFSRQVLLQHLAKDASANASHNADWWKNRFDRQSNWTSLFNNVMVFDKSGNMLTSLNALYVDDSVDLAARQRLQNALLMKNSSVLLFAEETEIKNPIIAMTVPVVDRQGSITMILVGLVDTNRDSFLSNWSFKRYRRHNNIYITNSDERPISPLNATTAANKINIAYQPSVSPPSRFGEQERTQYNTKKLSSYDTQIFVHLKSIPGSVGLNLSSIAIGRQSGNLAKRLLVGAITISILLAVFAWGAVSRFFLPLQRLCRQVDAAVNKTVFSESISQDLNNEIEFLAEKFEQLLRERGQSGKRYFSLEEKFHAAAGTSFDAFFLLQANRDRDGKIRGFSTVYMNEYAKLLTTRVQGKKDDLGNTLFPVCTQALFEKCCQLVEHQRPVQEELTIELPDAGLQWLNANAVVASEECIGLTIRDITALKQYEAELRNSRAFLQSLIDYLPVLVFAKSFRPESYGQLVVWNKTAETITGYSADNVLGKSNNEIFPPNVATTFDGLDQQMMLEPKVVSIPEFPYRRGMDGELFYLRSISVPLLGEDGKLEYILGIVENLTNRRKQEFALRAQQAELAVVNDALPLGVFRTDADGAYTYINRAYEKITGQILGEALGDGWQASVHPDDRDSIRKEWAHAVQTLQPYQAILRFLHLDGRIVWVSLKAAPIIVDTRASGYVGSIDDITAQFEVEQALARSEHRIRTITNNLPALIAYIDNEECFRFCNTAYENAFSKNGENLVGRTMRDVLGEERYHALSGRISTVLAGIRVNFERQFMEEGATRYWRIDYIPDRVEDGEVAGFYVMVMDITELKMVENQLRVLAHLDALTGLANRHYFDQKLNEAIARSQATGQPMALMFLDIDDFKKINDSDGHYGGDEILRQFARRLISCVRQTDTVARLAGDEFVIILENLHAADEMPIIAQKIIAQMEQHFELSDSSRRVTTSIGGAIRRDNEISAEMLLRRADEALYLAKSAGRNTFKVIL